MGPRRHHHRQRRPLRLLAAVLTLVVAAPAATAAPAAAAAPQADQIVVLRGADRSVAAETAERERALGFTAEHEYHRVIDGFAADLTDAQVRALKADPEVAMVVPNRRVSATAAVAAVDATRVPPGVHRVIQTAGGTVRQQADGAVAVLDTGVDLDHPDLNVSPGTNCIAPGTPPDDVAGHGTHVAGTIAARNDNQGVTGVAPGTTIIAVKVLDDTGSGDTASILCGAEWVLANATARNITVANFSLGGSGPVSTCSNDPQHAVFCALANAGITPVVAAGNDGRDFAGSTRDVPAAYPQVLTVAAIADTDGTPGGLGPAAGCSGGADDTYASFSNFATRAADEAHLVAAPGVCIRSTYSAGRYARMSGTSMAAPHVAGLVALCKGEGGVAGPCAGLTTPQIIARMRVQTSWSGFTGVDGRLFGPLAVLPDSATPTPTPAPVVESSPETTDTAGGPTAEPSPAPAEQPAPAPQPAVLAPYPAPALPASPVRSRRPVLTLTTPRLATLRRSGLSAVLSCPRMSCSGMIRLRVSKLQARRLGLKSTILATAWPEREGAVKLRLNRATRAALKTARTFKAELVAELELDYSTVRSATTLTFRR